MTLSRTSRQVVALMREITERGPDGPEYDGLRVFQHPSRIRQHLTGNTTQIPPVTIDFWPSLSCNARCPLCQYRISGARNAADISRTRYLLGNRLADVILTGAASAGVRSIILTGGGEPLLNPRVTYIARSAREHGLSWGLITNGLLLSAEAANALLRERPAFFRVSLDAGTPETRSALYGAPPGDFDRVTRNIVAAAKVSSALKAPVFGVSFALGVTTTARELGAIRKHLERIIKESEGGLRFIVFRPRLRHYAGLQPICPQPNGDRFRLLADLLIERVIKPVANSTRYPIRLDLKKGLFALAGRDRMRKGCLSGPWMTTITHAGEGYLTGELAGAKDSGQCWGTIRRPKDFASAWHAKKSQNLQKALLIGDIPVPIVHRTSPIDEFLHLLSGLTGGPVEPKLADEIIAAVGKAPWYRSGGSDFV